MIVSRRKRYCLKQAYCANKCSNRHLCVSNFNNWLFSLYYTMFIQSNSSLIASKLNKWEFIDFVWLVVRRKGCSSHSKKKKKSTEKIALEQREIKISMGWKSTLDWETMKWSFQVEETNDQPPENGNKTEQKQQNHKVHSKRLKFISFVYFFTFSTVRMIVHSQRKMPCARVCLFVEEKTHVHNMLSW